MTGYRVFNFWFYPPTWIDFCLLFALKFNNHFLLNIFCFRFIWRTSCVQFLILSTNVDWLLFTFCVEVQLMLFVKRFLFFPPVEADSSLASPDCEELNEVEQFCKNCETELHSSEPDVIQDTARSACWLHSPTWIDFWLIIALKSNQCF